mmetsp:Transcript_39047/g.59491  ORF Transcript_39047/g.59491 Transcript_39047/m.59491 type:complete len:88 (+) Transcript_39047:924-1187(+)
MSASFKLTAKRIQQSTLNEGNSSFEESVSKEERSSNLVLLNMLKYPEIQTQKHISVISEPPQVPSIKVAKASPVTLESDAPLLVPEA